MEKVQVTLFTLAALGCFMMAPVSAFNHVVGGGLGWAVPPNTTFYRDWAKPRIFGVGDKLGKSKAFVSLFLNGSLFWLAWT